MDELNSFMGVLRAQLNAASTTVPHQLDSQLSRVQHELFDLGGELCIPNFILVKQTSIDRLEQGLIA